MVSSRGVNGSVRLDFNGKPKSNHNITKKSKTELNHQHIITEPTNCWSVCSVKLVVHMSTILSCTWLLRIGGGQKSNILNKILNILLLELNLAYISLTPTPNIPPTQFEKITQTLYIL